MTDSRDENNQMAGQRYVLHGSERVHFDVTHKTAVEVEFAVRGSPEGRRNQVVVPKNETGEIGGTTKCLSAHHQSTTADVRLLVIGDQITMSERGLLCPQ